MKTSLSVCHKLVLSFVTVLVMSSCASEADLKAALQDYNSGNMAYEVRRKSQQDARQEPVDGRIQHMMPY